MRAGLCLVLLGFLSTVDATASEPPTIRLEPVQRLDDEDAEALEDEENPFTVALEAPLALPWFWNACLDGFAPWGRANWIKMTCSMLTMGLGATMFMVFPCSFLFTAFMFVGAVLAAVAAVYAFITTGCRQGCLPTGATYKRGNLALSSLLDVWTWAMCFSFVLCTPWFGFKLVQRAWYAIQDPVPERRPARRKGSRARPPEDLEEDPGSDVTPTASGIRF